MRNSSNHDIRRAELSAEVENTAIRQALGSLPDSPIIAAVSDEASFEAALLTPPKLLYVLTGNPLTLPQMIERAKRHDKLCLLNMDFLDGLSRDRYAVEYLAAHGPAGIVSTRIDPLKVAQSLGLHTILRTFAIDSAAVIAAKKSLAQFQPTAVEVLPAMVAPKVAKRLAKDLPDLRIIAGGLIDTVREIEELLASGVQSITTSNPRLWLI